jgi:hypothetical protein
MRGRPRHKERRCYIIGSEPGRENNNPKSYRERGRYIGLRNDDRRESVNEQSRAYLLCMSSRLNFKLDKLHDKMRAYGSGAVEGYSR